MVGHQAVADQVYPVQGNALPQQTQIDFAIGVAGKDELARIPPLGNVVRYPNSDHPGQTRHTPYLMTPGRSAGLAKNFAQLLLRHNKAATKTTHPSCSIVDELSLCGPLTALHVCTPATVRPGLRRITAVLCRKIQLTMRALPSGVLPQCVGDRILHTICCSRTMDLGLHIAVHARKKSFLRHTVRPLITVGCVHLIPDTTTRAPAKT
jgi:hypothetical protein